MEWIIAVVGAHTTAQDGANFTVRQAMSEAVWLAAHPRLHICLPIVQTLSGCLSARPSFRLLANGLSIRPSFRLSVCRRNMTSDFSLRSARSLPSRAVTARYGTLTSGCVLFN